MYALTLRQPWASAVRDRHKQWETRGWKPSKPMQHILRTEGFLIHSAGTIKPEEFDLRFKAPWFKFYPIDAGLAVDLWPVSHLLCHVYLGRLITVEDWLDEFDPFKLTGDQPAGLRNHPTAEHLVGDYRRGLGRWAWELIPGLELTYSDKNPVKGKLSLWQCPGHHFNFKPPYDV